MYGFKPSNTNTKGNNDRDSYLSVLLFGASAKTVSASVETAAETTVPLSASAETPAPSSASAETAAPSSASAETPAPSSASVETPAPSSASVETPAPSSASAETPAPSSALEEKNAKRREYVGKETVVKETDTEINIGFHGNATQCGNQITACIDEFIGSGKILNIVGDFNATAVVNPNGTVSILHKEDKTADGTPKVLWTSPTDGYRVYAGFNQNPTTNKKRGGGGQFKKYGKISKASIDGIIIIIPPNYQGDVSVETKVYVGTGVKGKISETLPDDTTTIPGFPSDHAIVIITIIINGEKTVIATWNTCGESGDGEFNWAEFAHQAFNPHLSRFKQILRNLAKLKLWWHGRLRTFTGPELIKMNIIASKEGLRNEEIQNVQPPPPGMIDHADPVVQEYAQRCVEKYNESFKTLFEKRDQHLRLTSGWRVADNRIRMALYLHLEVHRRVFTDKVLAPCYADLFIQKAHEMANPSTPMDFILPLLHDDHIDTFCLQEVSRKTLVELFSNPSIRDNYDITTSHDDLSGEELAKVKTFGVILTRKSPAEVAGVGTGSSWA
jgi:hypothetical protein